MTARNLSNPLGFVLAAAFPTLCGEASKPRAEEECPECGEPLRGGFCDACKAFPYAGDSSPPAAAPRDERKGEP